jgi:lipid-binding SYLF domain-containing protein
MSKASSTALSASLLVASVLGLSALTACSNYREAGGDETISPTREALALSTVSDFKTADPSMSKFFGSAVAWAVFPDISKGAVIVGGAGGDGVVYNRAGTVVGYSTMRQLSVGAALGGQSYSQIIFFQDEAAFSRFRTNRTDFSANASAVIAKSGAAAANDYNQGIAVFAKPKAGVMAEASLGGQKYEYIAK